MAVFLDYCQHANGLLLAQGSVATVADGVPEPVYAFPHLSFEEYLAARHLRRLRVEHSSFTRKAAELASEPAWREVVRFLGEYLCHDKEGGDIVYAKDLLAQLCPHWQPTGDPDWRRIWLAYELLADLRQESAEAERDIELEKRIVKRLVELLPDPAALQDSFQVRFAVGRALAQEGDPRPGVRVRPNGLPDLLWVRILGTATVRNSGRFPGFVGLKLGKGSKPDPKAHYDETWPENAESLEIADFELAAYPVTVAQFRPFVEQGGYREERYWSKAGWQYREGGWKAPRFWDDLKWTSANHPVIGVSWYEAEAYCNWLNAQLPTDQTVRLPTEVEWEWVARGPEGRIYPWGDQWEAWRCNNKGLKIQRTSAVGAFPGGVADWWRVIWSESEGIHDLAGNVWEWTASEYTADYAGAHRSVLNADHGGPCVLRGGSWDDAAQWVRGAVRHSGSPHYGGGAWGFRLART